MEGVFSTYHYFFGIDFVGMKVFFVHDDLELERPTVKNFL